MNRKENLNKVINVLEELQVINTKKLKRLQKYSDSRRIFYNTAERLNALDQFYDIRLQDCDMVNLEKIIKDKNKVINQFLRILENEVWWVFNV